MGRGGEKLKLERKEGCRGGEKRKQLEGGERLTKGGIKECCLAGWGEGGGRKGRKGKRYPGEGDEGSTKGKRARSPAHLPSPSFRGNKMIIGG